MTDLFDDVELPKAAATFSPVVVIPVSSADAVALDQLRVLMKLPTWPDVLIELVHRAAPSTNGIHGYEVACFSCGKKFHVKRRPIPGRRSWCETCKAAGEPAAQRARDYRSRKSENGGTI